MFGGWVLLDQDVVALQVPVHQPQFRKLVDRLEHPPKQILEEGDVPTEVHLERLVADVVDTHPVFEAALDVEGERVERVPAQLLADPDVLAVDLALVHLADHVPAFADQVGPFVRLLQALLHFDQLRLQFHFVSGCVHVGLALLVVRLRGLLERDGLTPLLHLEDGCEAPLT